MTIFPLPDLGEGLQEAEVVEWHVAAGDAVAAGAALVTVETDKAQVEVASPADAVVARLLARPGDVVAVGAPLVEFEGEVAGVAREAPSPGDAGTVVGELPTATAERPRAQRIVPAARARARELGVDPDRIAGSGPGGSVTRADVERAAAVAAEGYEPLRGVRFAMSRNMARAHRVVVPATVTGEADVESWAESADTTLRLLRAVAAACAAEPALNAWLDTEGRHRRLHDEVHCGVALDTREGLFVPVLRDIGGRAPDALRGDLDALARAIESRSVARAAMGGATITLSNFGSLGGRFAQLVVMPPQVAIVGAGRSEPRVVARDGAPAVRRILPLSVSFDHRAVSGGEATRFLQTLIRDLQLPS